MLTQVQGDKAQQENCSTGAVVDDVAENLHVRMEVAALVVCRSKHCMMHSSLLLCSS